MEPAQLEAAIFQYLGEKLGIEEPDMDRDSELISSGLVDSGNLVRLATHLERITGVSIPDRDIDVEHFDTVGTIVEYVLARLDA